jgi:hypothetical protein
VTDRLIGGLARAPSFVPKYWHPLCEDVGLLRCNLGTEGVFMPAHSQIRPYADAFPVTNPRRP